MCLRAVADKVGIQCVVIPFYASQVPTVGRSLTPEWKSICGPPGSFHLFSSFSATVTRSVTSLPAAEFHHSSLSLSQAMLTNLEKEPGRGRLEELQAERTTSAIAVRHRNSRQSFVGTLNLEGLDIVRVVTLHLSFSISATTSAFLSSSTLKPNSPA